VEVFSLVALEELPVHQGLSAPRIHPAAEFVELGRWIGRCSARPARSLCRTALAGLIAQIPGIPESFAEARRLGHRWATKALFVGVRSTNQTCSTLSEAGAAIAWLPDAAAESSNLSRWPGRPGARRVSAIVPALPRCRASQLQ